MTYIAPNSTIRLIKGCKIPSDNTHSIYFANSNAQQNYFLNLDGYTLNNQMYIKKGESRFRCSLPVADIYDCNYLMYKNTSFENFWFYAFIDEIEYLNNGNADVKFTIDPIQTWFIQKLTLKESFVEREHSASDNIGEHLEPESLSLGEYTMNSYGDLFSESEYETIRQYAILVAIVDTSTDKGSEGHLYDGIYGGATLYAYRQGDSAGVNNKINEYVSAGKPDAIVSIYLTPQFFVEPYLDTDDHKVGEVLKGRSLSRELSAITASDSLNGYVPKNKKLYTYPYNFLQIDNSNGSSLTCRYEFFENLTPKFKFSGSIVQPIQLILQPMNYKGISNDHVNYAETLSISSFPVCSWNYDAYQAWSAQSQIPMLLNYGSTIASGAISGAMLGGGAGALVGGVGSALAGATSVLSQDYSASIKADTLSGNFNCGNANFSQGNQTFHVGRFSITSNIAKRIDDYFSKYGYSCGRLKVPNISVRSHWNFVKTSDCNLTGNAPADDIKTIKQIFNTGITFWRNGSEMFNYDLDNSI